MSLVEALALFTEPGPGLSLVAPIFELNQRFRLVNSYHLFASVTRERIEPQFETRDAPLTDESKTTAAWTERELRWKAGDPRRAPGFVAPHQPRVDFQLWFYGLAFQRREPPYVTALVEKLCNDAASVQPLFRDPLSASPDRRAHRLLAVPVRQRRRTARVRHLVAPRPRRREPRDSLQRIASVSVPVQAAGRRRGRCAARRWGRCS